MRARAHQSHEIPTRLPLHIRRGDRLDVGERSNEWPAFVFVSSPDGSGWVPSRYLDMDAGGAVAVRTYDTTELPVSSGQEVAVI